MAFMAPIGDDERARIVDYLLNVSEEMDGQRDPERLSGMWEDVRQMAFAVKAGLFAKPGPYMLLAAGDLEPPPGWEVVEGLSGNWARMKPPGS